MVDMLSYPGAKMKDIWRTNTRKTVTEWMQRNGSKILKKSFKNMLTKSHRDGIIIKYSARDEKHIKIERNLYVNQ